MFSRIGIPTNKVSALFRGIAVLFALAVLSACASGERVVKEVFEEVKPPVRVVVLDPDVQLGEFTSGGDVIINDAWSIQAAQHIRTHLRSKMGLRDVETVYVADAELNEDEELAYMRSMFQTVGNSIQNYDILPVLRLPTKANNFRWTLGPTIDRLRERHNADFALFTWVHDTYASADRVALIVVGAILGIGVQGGTQQGYMGLVDLRDGRVVWFNRIQRGTGDLRTVEAAESSVDALIGNFPFPEVDSAGS